MSSHYIVMLISYYVCIYINEQAVEYMDMTHETHYNIKLDTVKLNSLKGIDHRTDHLSMILLQQKFKKDLKN